MTAWAMFLGEVAAVVGPANVHADRGNSGSEAVETAIKTARRYHFTRTIRGGSRS